MWNIPLHIFLCHNLRWITFWKPALFQNLSSKISSHFPPKTPLTSFNHPKLANIFVCLKFHLSTKGTLFFSGCKNLWRKYPPSQSSRKRRSFHVARYPFSTESQRMRRSTESIRRWLPPRTKSAKSPNTRTLTRNNFERASFSLHPFGISHPQLAGEEEMLAAFPAKSARAAVKRESKTKWKSAKSGCALFFWEREIERERVADWERERARMCVVLNEVVCVKGKMAEMWEKGCDNDAFEDDLLEAFDGAMMEWKLKQNLRLKFRWLCYLIFLSVGWWFLVSNAR